jgi:glycine/D-amino acid oxidase-like deaminating enzyme
MAATHPVYLQPCGWQSLLVQRCPEPRLRQNLTCELAVVGAGYTGLAAARTWAEARPQDRVAVLDASIVGEGSPGRNSGFMLEIALADDADPSAVDRMAKCNDLIGEAMDWLRSLVQTHDIRCDLVRSGTYRAAATAQGQKAIQRYRAFLAAAGLRYEELDRSALETRLGTGCYRYGLYSPDCSLVQPAALIRGLADSLPNNVTIHEETPVVEIKPEANGFWRVECPAGSLLARRVVLANNAFVRGLGVGASRLTAMYTYAGLTAPLGESLLQQLGTESNWGLLPAHRLGSTLRRTADGRLMVRSFYGYEREEDNDRVAERLRRCLLRRFPQLALQSGMDAPNQPFQYVWGGTTGLTYNGAPLWGEVKPGLFVSAGCNGGGVVKGTLFGRLLAGQALGRPVPDPRPLFGSASWMPPEPIRRLGFSLMSAVERLAAGGET